MDINDVLSQRHKTHGAFCEQSKISQALKDIIRGAEGYCDLPPPQKESLEMIAHKMARILSGRRNFIDNYRDIAGYSTLIVNELSKTDGASDTKTVNVSLVDGEWCYS